MLSRTSTRGVTLLAVLLLLAGWAAAQVPQPQQQPLLHPRLHAALHELRSARQELASARSDYKGRKQDVLVAIDGAISSIEMLLRSRGDNVAGFDRDPDLYRRFPDHPHLRQALHDLREARDELRESWDGFGEPRVRALRDVGAAINLIQDVLPVRQGGDVKYPCMHQALAELYAARAELTTARDDFGTRKETALAAIDDAIGSLRKILEVKGDALPDPRFARQKEYYSSYRTYPRLRQTVHDLREARDELRECGVDFRGLKDRALRDMSVAISNIQAMVDR